MLKHSWEMRTLSSIRQKRSKKKQTRYILTTSKQAVRRRKKPFVEVEVEECLIASDETQTEEFKTFMGNHIKAEKDLVYEVVKLTPFYATTVDSKRKDVTLEALEEAVPEKYMALLDKEISAAFEDDVSIASKDLTQLPRGNKHNDYLPVNDV